MRTHSMLLLTAGLALAGCGPDEFTKTLQDARYDVGGAVVYAGDTSQGLEGASVVVKDLNGKELAATTNADGLWVVENVPPGVYTETYTLEGYEDYTGQFVLEAVGENDFKDMFVGRGTVGLQETQLKGSLGAPFSVDVEDGDSLANGIAGMDLVYSRSGDSFITLTFNKPVYTDPYAMRLQDGVTGYSMYATPNQDLTAWTFSKQEIESLGGNGLTADGDGSTLHTITITNALSYTEIHGDETHVNATIRFDCVP